MDAALKSHRVAMPPGLTREEKKSFYSFPSLTESKGILLFIGHHFFNVITMAEAYYSQNT